MIQKVRKAEVNSSLESEDMQLNGEEWDDAPSLRSNRTQPLELETQRRRTFLLHTRTQSHARLRATADTSGILTHSCKFVYILQT